MTMIIDGSNGLTYPNSTVQASAGSVLQVVNATYGTPVTTTSVGTMVSTGLTASITPKFATSKILVLINHNGAYRTGTIYSQMDMQLVRNSTVITYLAFNSMWNGNFSGLTVNYGTTLSTAYLDSPATTSSTTYATQYQISVGGSGTVGLQFANAVSTITLLEIAQ